MTETARLEVVCKVHDCQNRWEECVPCTNQRAQLDVECPHCHAKLKVSYEMRVANIYTQFRDRGTVPLSVPGME